MVTFIVLNRMMMLFFIHILMIVNFMIMMVLLFLVVMIVVRVLVVSVVCVVMVQVYIVVMVVVVMLLPYNRLVRALLMLMVENGGSNGRKENDYRHQLHDF